MLKTLDKIDLENKRVLVRVDFNVPIDKNGKVVDDFRIKCFLPTLKYILKKNPKQIILMSHLDPWKDNPAIKKDPRLRMDNIAKRLEKLINKKVAKVNDCININLPKDKIILLENLRFYKGEKENNMIFAKKLAKNSDVYVNDAFGTCHRAHASVDVIIKYFKDFSVGLLIEKEIKMLNPILKKPERPFYAIIGGAKVKSKIKMIEKFSKIADKILIGGKMALAFENIPYIEKEEIEIAKKLLKKHSKKIILPIDYVTEDKIRVSVKEIPKNKNIYDIGAKTIDSWKKILIKASLVTWNGPLGYFEKKPFDNSTKKIAKFLAKLKAKTIIEGGDTSNALRKLKLHKKMTYISTGGGATLEFLEGERLPSLEALGYY